MLLGEYVLGGLRLCGLGACLYSR